ncbi:MAG: two-component system nitrogen regulation response regulator NtrX [Lentimonas sp.]|jgi:two-component system nitrogen regulation response regulator NtrX
MAYSVLILDDDVDFNSLLTDIFEQADYIVTSLEDPIAAVEVFENTDYDLVVTDHKMPDMSGAQFMTAIKKLKPEVPVIMVSGFLENDTIRSLISGGVGGVFLKPLNIFSLLERTAELIEESRRFKDNDQSDQFFSTGGDAVEGDADLGFNFRSFPCKSRASIDFAERLFSLRNFKSTLSLIGEVGTQFRLICEDIRNFYESEKEHFICLSPGSFDAEQVLFLLDEAKRAGAERVTCVLLDVESMSDEQRLLVVSLSKCTGAFESIAIPSRTIYCVSGDLDELFDEGRIDEHLYVLMGTAEVRVPSLRDCASDIAILAQQMVVDIIREKGLGSVSRFDASARGFLEKHLWDHNYEQLRAVVRQVMESNPGDVLALAAVAAAVQSNTAASPRARFEASLSHARVDYVRAALILLGGDKAKVSAFFATDVTVIEATLK